MPVLILDIVVLNKQQQPGRKCLLTRDATGGERSATAISVGRESVNISQNATPASNAGVRNSRGRLQSFSCSVIQTFSVSS
jgi:hypothetical protein